VIFRLKAETTESRLQAESASGRSFRLRAEVLVLVVLLSACAAKASRPADDLTITTAVKIALLSDAQVGGLRLEVKTVQGMVTLSGTVKSDADARQAAAVARQVRGVRGVTSELKIQP
jgi:osmotically-inducible protein OsmY